MKVSLILLGVIALVVTEEESKADDAPKDDGNAFELEWTEKDKGDCPKNVNVDISYCNELEVGKVVKVPSLDDCVEWKSEAFKHDKNYDVKGYCTSNRRGCLYLKQVRDTGEEPAYWLKSMCAETNSRLWSKYETQVESGSGEGFKI